MYNKLRKLLQGSAEEPLSREWEARATSAVAELSTVLVSRTSIDDISLLVLEQAQRLTGSPVGFVGYLDPRTGALVCPASTADFGGAGRREDEKNVFEEFTGLWGWVLTNRSPLLINDPQAAPRSQRTPSGRPPRTRFLSAPALFGNVLMGQIALADAPTEYGQRDLRLVERLAALYAVAVHHKRADDELHRVNKMLQALITSAPVAIDIIDPTGNVLLWNPAAERIFGWSEAEVLGRPLPTVHAELRDEFQGMLRNLLEGQGFSGRESRRMRKDGAYIEANLSTAPVRDAEGAIIGALDIIVDMTEKKRTEEALKASSTKISEEQAKTEAVIAGLGDGISIIDTDYTITYQNAIHRALFGDCLGSRCHAALAVQARRCDGCPAATAFEDGAVHRAERRLTLNGRLLHLEETASPLRDAAGKITGGIVVSRDVTARKQLEEQLLQAQKMEAVGQLAGGIAHDFNNILTAISGQAYLLRNNLGSDTRLSAHVDIILSSADKAAHLIQGLLAFSRKQVSLPQAVDVNDILRSTEQLLSRLIGEDISLDTRCAEERLMVKADLGQIEQVIVNLATNARDAMQHGGTLSLATSSETITDEFIHRHGFGAPGAYAVIEVGDTGEGMDEATQKRIFEPFFTTKEVGKGTGLGLSIAYGSIKQHNGYITVQSERGSGTVFKVYLPLVRSDARDRGRGTPLLPALGTETILLAEDDGEVRRLACEILERFGYRVIEAVDGEDAIEKFREHRDAVQLAIVDVVMPKRNGREVYTALRSLNPSVKVIFTSGYTPDIIQAKGGMDGEATFLSKPILPTRLLSAVRTVLDG